MKFKLEAKLSKKAIGNRKKKTLGDDWATVFESDSEDECRKYGESFSFRRPEWRYRVKPNGAVDA